MEFKIVNLKIHAEVTIIFVAKESTQASLLELGQTSSFTASLVISRQIVFRVESVVPPPLPGPDRSGKNYNYKSLFSPYRLRII